MNEDHDIILAMSVNKKRLIGMFLDQNFPPDIRVEKEIHTLMEAGYDVKLFALSYQKNKAIEEVRGIKIFRYNGGTILYKLSALAYTLPFFHMLVKQKVKNFVKQHKPDFLHVHDMVIAPSVAKVSNSFKIPLILDLHENRPAIMELYAHVNKFPGKYLINLNNWKKGQINLERKADKLILITEEAKKNAVDVEGVNSDKIYVVPNTVKKDFEEDLLSSSPLEERFRDKFCLLYFGDTAIRRGTDTIIDTVYYLKDKIRSIHAIIVGDGSEDSKLKIKANNLGISDKISFEGWRDVNLLKSYANISAIGVCPFKRNLHHDTTFANKLFQFMGLRLPVIVSDCPSQVNIIEKFNCGLAFKADDPLDFSEKVLKLFHSTDERKKLGQNGKNAIQNELNWERTSASLIDLYKSFN